MRPDFNRLIFKRYIYNIIKLIISNTNLINIKGEITLCIGYDSGLEDHYVERMIIIKRYKNYIRLIPEDNNYNWIIEELINLFIINKEYSIIVK